ncbi:hypothetical protein [Actinocrispum sp. NPDC049592]|uniref:hypothetical protein n=1 Tax=Actinocrispum sp. NPDC049592 TaxID=3154835 RepID=UPI003419946C
MSKGARLVAGTAVTSGSLVTAILTSPVLTYGLIAVMVLLLVGILLPAVWSARSQRRGAALTVIQVLLNRRDGPDGSGRPTGSDSRTS